MILVLAEIIVPPSATIAFHEALRSRFALFRAETGCLSYSVAIEDAAEGRLIAIEKWRDRVAMDAHNAGSELIAAVTPFLGSFDAKIETIELPNA